MYLECAVNDRNGVTRLQATNYVETGVRVESKEIYAFDTILDD